VDSIQKQARTAGAIYLLLSLIAPFSLMYVPSRVIVRGNAAATAEKLLSHEMLFRCGIVADLLSSVVFIGVAFALYRLLARVQPMWAEFMVALVLVSAAVGFLNTLNNIAALTLVRGSDFLSALEKPQRESLAMLFLRLHGQGTFMNQIFWGLWLFPFGLLVFRSGFLPRFLGIWLILNGVAYVVLSLIALLWPGHENFALRFAVPFLLGEVVTLLWLLIRGAKKSADRTDLPAIIPHPAT
jgi:hypothetical protein